MAAINQSKPDIRVSWNQQGEQRRFDGGSASISSSIADYPGGAGEVCVGVYLMHDCFGVLLIY